MDGDGGWGMGDGDGIGREGEERMEGKVWSERLIVWASV